MLAKIIRPLVLTLVIWTAGWFAGSLIFVGIDRINYAPIEGATRYDFLQQWSFEYLWFLILGLVPFLIFTSLMVFAQSKWRIHGPGRLAALGATLLSVEVFLLGPTTSLVFISPLGESVLEHLRWLDIPLLAATLGPMSAYTEAGGTLKGITATVLLGALLGLTFWRTREITAPWQKDNTQNHEARINHKTAS